AGFQGAGEEGVETGKGERIGLLRLVHVHVEMREHLTDQQVFPPAHFAARGGVRQAREKTMRQHVLCEDAGRHQRLSTSRRRSAAIFSGSSGGRMKPASRASGSRTATQLVWSMV